MTTRTSTAPVGNLDAVVDGYFAVWNETDPTRRRQTMQSTWAENARYIDPMFSAEGAEALDALVAGVHKHYPGHRFRLVGSIDAHNDRARWRWEFFSPAGGAPIAAGVDFATLGADGRLSEVIGFFEHPQQAA